MSVGLILSKMEQIEVTVIDIGGVYFYMNIKPCDTPSRMKPNDGLNSEPLCFKGNGDTSGYLALRALFWHIL